MYSVEEAMVALNAKNKSVLARKLRCTPQRIYSLEMLTANLSHITEILVENENLSNKVIDLESVILTKNEIIKALR